MPAIIAAILLFIGAAVGNINLGPTGSKLIPDIPPPTGGNIACLKPDISSTAPLALNGLSISKPDNINVPFVEKAVRPGLSCQGKPGSCETNPWDGSSVPTFAQYVTAVSNIRIGNIWPDEETTRLYKQKLPPPCSDSTNPDCAKPEVDTRYFANADPAYDGLRDLVYRATCNDWCFFIPPKRIPALPYGGTFFCEFIFLLHADQPLKERNVDGKIELYPDDSQCDLENNPEKCPLFDILIRKDAPVPEFAGGAAPGSTMKPIRCDLLEPTPVSGKNNLPWLQELANLTNLSIFAQPETFIYLLGETWIFEEEKSTYNFKIKSEAEGRKLLTDDAGQPLNVNFRGENYWAYQDLIKSFRTDWKGFVFLVGFDPDSGKNYIEIAEEELANGNLNYYFPYLQFRRSREIQPQGKTLQLGTFEVPVTSGWWELFVEESKPAIYLYPEKPTKFRIKLNPAGHLTVSDPPYDPKTGWEITAYPNGDLKPLGNQNTSDGDPQRRAQRGSSEVKDSSYPYLFYEANLEKVFVRPEGFIIEGKNLVEFFKKTLSKLGLNEREIADFIEYWMGRLDESTPYYFIHFLETEQIETLEPLIIEKINSAGNLVPVKPDTEIRIRTYFKPLNNPIQVKPVKDFPKAPERTGFTLVEWGGILDNSTPGVD